MSKSYDPTRRSATERILHALAFEGLATLICAPVIAWSMDKSIIATGLLTLMFAFTAMGWNMVFNVLFDRAQRRIGFTRNIRVRILHALLFELGLIFILVPVAAWWLSVGLVEAFLLDIGLLLFFLPYTMAFNWTYDTLRAQRFSKREAAQAAGG